MLVADSYQYGVLIEDPRDFAMDEEGGVWGVWDRRFVVVVGKGCDGEQCAE